MRFRNKSVAHGYDWGKQIVSKCQDKRVAKAKDEAVEELSKISDVCYSYATNKKINKTKKGTSLTEAKRDFFEGAFLGISNNIFK